METVMPVIVCKKYYKKCFIKNKDKLACSRFLRLIISLYQGYSISFPYSFYGELSLKSNYRGLVE
jgi:hypothetical protein